jgi:DNA polymerase
VSEREELRKMVSSLKDAVKAKGKSAGASKKRAPKTARAPAPVAKEAPARPAAQPALTHPQPPVLSLAPSDHFVNDVTLSAEEKLRRLREDEIGDCRRCPLGATRIKLVFGVGNPRAKVMFVGEGPGYHEDRQGEPFVGVSGQLLDKILDATGLSRQRREPDWSWVYIANMVKDHPMIDPSDNTKRGNDRPPSPEETAACVPFLMMQVRIVRPLFIVTLGATAGKWFMKTEKGISTFRGQWADWSPEGEPGLKVRLLPTYHPAALLRNPALKKDVWDDMKKLRTELQKAVGA